MGNKLPFECQTNQQKVDGVILHKKGYVVHGSLHLTTHHLIFTMDSTGSGTAPGGAGAGPREIWLCYPMISSVERRNGSALLALINSEEQDADDMGDLSTLNQLPKLANKPGQQLNLFKLTTIKISCKDFNCLSFDFENESESFDVFESIMKLTCLNDISQLYGFIYEPNPTEKKFNTWTIYDSVKEFERQGLDFTTNDNRSSASSWRVSLINSDYKFCETYPSKLVVPKTISDSVLNHASKYRSKQRIPVLTYYHKKTGCTITRCSQPLLGIQQSRSIQDEKLVDEIFKSGELNEDDDAHNGAHRDQDTAQDGQQKSTIRRRSRNKNLIIDARPTTNAMAQTALGAGSENMDNYLNCEKIYLGIDNIHVMRDSLNKLNELLKSNDLNKPKLNQVQLDKTMWLKYISLLLQSTEKLSKSLVLNKTNILIHCSDGWDRTSQISSLIQICIDPFYRTIDGFIILVEKDWLAFGHRFLERSGHLSSESIFNDEISNKLTSLKTVSNHFKKKKHLKFTSPIFHQFLDSTFQLLNQFPNEFEFNERFLRRLLYHLYSCQFGNFLMDNEYERVKNNLPNLTRSVWDYFLSRRNEFSNKSYNPTEAELISPNFNKLKWWWQLYGRSDQEMNGNFSLLSTDIELKSKLTDSQITIPQETLQQMSIS